MKVLQKNVQKTTSIKEWLEQNLDCNAIAKYIDDSRQKIIIIAVAKGREDTVKLREYFEESCFGNDYFMIQGISSREVNKID